MSRFKISIWSTNSFIKECLDDSSIRRAVTEELTDALDTEDNLKVENDLMNDLFEQSELVIDKVMVSATNLRY